MSQAPERDDHPVERRVLGGAVLRVGAVEGHPAVSGGGDPAGGQVDHLGVGVDRDDLALRADQLGEERGVAAPTSRQRMPRSSPACSSSSASSCAAETRAGRGAVRVGRASGSSAYAGLDRPARGEQVPGHAAEGGGDARVANVAPLPQPESDHRPRAAAPQRTIVDIGGPRPFDIAFSSPVHVARRNHDDVPAACNPSACPASRGPIATLEDNPRRPMFTSCGRRPVLNVDYQSPMRRSSATAGFRKGASLRSRLHDRFAEC